MFTKKIITQKEKISGFHQRLLYRMGLFTFFDTMHPTFVKCTPSKVFAPHITFQYGLTLQTLLNRALFSLQIYLYTLHAWKI